MQESWNLILGVIALILSGVGSMWGFSIWIQKAFSEIKDKLLGKIEDLEKNILAKLEYHERHDDNRFNQVHKDIWELKLHNAAADAKLKAKYLESIK